MTPLAADIDNAGEEGHDARTHRSVGAQAQLAQNHPVPQGALGVVVGERQFGMAQNLEDGLPVVDQLHRQRVGFRIHAAPVVFAGGEQRGEPRRVAGRQIDRGRAFAGGVYRRLQGFQGFQHDPAEGAGRAVAALDQAPRLAKQMSPAAQSARVVVVGHPPIRSVLFVINFIFRCPRTLFRLFLPQ